MPIIGNTVMSYSNLLLETTFYVAALTVSDQRRHALLCNWAHGEVPCQNESRTITNKKKFFSLAEVFCRVAIGHY